MDPNGLGLLSWVEGHTIGALADVINDNVSQSTLDGINNFSAGLGDDLLLGQGDRLRRIAGADGNVDPCSTAYTLGGYAPMLNPAGLIKGGLKRALSKKCFAAGTLVHTARGLIPIEEVVIGDFVWSRDDETGEEDWQQVVQLFVTPEQPVWKLQIETANGRIQELIATSGHPFWAINGWVAVVDLVVDDVVWARDSWADVVSVADTGERETVYNFEVADFHTYFVGDEGVWTHNVCTLRFPRRGGSPGERLSGRVPNRGELAKMSRDQLSELAEMAETSLKTRRAEMAARGPSGKHGTRIGQEQQMLNNILDML